MSSLNSRSGWAFSSGSHGGNSGSAGMVSTIGGTSRSRGNGRTKSSVGRATGNGNATITRPEVFVHVEQHELNDRMGLGMGKVDEAQDVDDGASSVYGGKGSKRDDDLV